MSFIFLYFIGIFFFLINLGHFLEEKVFKKSNF